MITRQIETAIFDNPSRASRPPARAYAEQNFLSPERGDPNGEGVRVNAGIFLGVAANVTHFYAQLTI